MRCPKCHYISFESSDRCRNCGYDFSLAEPPAPLTAELPLNDRDEDPLAPIDLSLAQVEGLDQPRAPEPPVAFDVERIQTRNAATPFDLPLFRSARDPRGGAAAARDPHAHDTGDAPLIRPAPAPRPPIAVRRATPDAQRLRSRYSIADVPRLQLEPPVADAETDEDVTAPVAVTPAPPGRRLLAAALDIAIVGGINVGVLYFTLKLCGLPLSLDGVLALPVVPLVGFLLMLDGGYAVTFTAAVGQTIGKMAAGLKVVHVNGDDESNEHPNFGFAVLRTAAYAASLLPVGLGFLPALIGKDRRALHDRLAETRVIYGVRS
jgi:uncharacterized RDD family membrane protein YckC